MIHSLTFKNFFSYLDEATVSFRVGKRGPGDGRAFVSPAGESLVMALAAVGANGSGKTNLLKPLAFLKWFVTSSFQSKPGMALAIETHAAQADEGTASFTVEFETGGRPYRYELAVTAERVVREALYEKTSKFFSYRFTREWDEQAQRYDIRQKGFGLRAQEAGRTRENASFVATAAQYGVPLALTIAGFFDRIITNIDAMGRQHFDVADLFDATKVYSGIGGISDTLSKLLHKWDFGLSAVEFRSIKVVDTEGKERETLVPFGRHAAAEVEFYLPLYQESSGTQTAFVLLSRLLPALRSGGVVVLDELDADLHPHMLSAVLDLFFNATTNPLRAQLLFSCHSPEIFNLLHKSQILLVEKDPQFRSTVCRLDDIQGVRNDDNLYAKYMAGAYGAIPAI